MANYKSNNLLYPTKGTAQLNVKGSFFAVDDRERGKVFNFPATKPNIDIWSPDIWDDYFTSGTFTWSFWVKLRSLNATTKPTTSYGCVISKWYTANPTGGDNTFIIYANGTLYSSYSYTTSPTDGWKQELNKWVHMTYVLDKGQCKIYANGVEIPTKSQAATKEDIQTTKNTDLKIVDNDYE